MSKPFASKTITHIESYPLVKDVEAFILSFLLFKALSLYFLALTNFVNAKVVSKLSFVVSNLSFVDDKVDTLVLGNADKALAVVLDYKKKGEDTALAYKKKGEDTALAYKKKGEDIVVAYKQKGEAIVSPYKKKGEDIVLSYKKKGEDIVLPYKQKGEAIVTAYKKKGEDTVSSYLKPVNAYASSTVDKVLPKSKSTAAAAETEIAKSIEIVTDTYERSKDLLTTKSSELSTAVFSTYNKEFDSVKEKNYYVKVASASINTGVSLLKSVNSDYIQPLKSTTQSYVSDVAGQTKAKATSLLQEGTEVVQNGSGLNGSATIPVVSASA